MNGTSRKRTIWEDAPGLPTRLRVLHACKTRRPACRACVRACGSGKFDHGGRVTKSSRVCASVRVCIGVRKRVKKGDTTTRGCADNEGMKYFVYENNVQLSGVPCRTVDKTCTAKFFSI